MNNHLVAWALGGAGNTTFELPALRQPGSTTDFDYDTGYGSYQYVVLRVEALTAPQQTGNFTVTVLTRPGTATADPDLAFEPVVVPIHPGPLVPAPAKPMRDADLAIDPLTAIGATNLPTPLHPGGGATTTTGLNWILLSVPDGNIGTVSLTAFAGILQAGATVRYDVYDVTEVFVTSGTGTVASFKNLQHPGGSVAFTLSQVAAGNSYYLRVGLVAQPEVQLSVSASAVPKIILVSPTPPDGLADILNPGKYTLDQAAPTPDGQFSSTFGSFRAGPVLGRPGRNGLLSRTQRSRNELHRFVSFERHQSE